MRMSLTQRSPSLWRLWVNLSLADGWLSRTIRPRITWQVLPDPDSFKQERLCGRSKYPSQARLDLKLTPEAVNILTGLLVGYHELVLKQFVEMFNLFVTYINSAEDYLQFYTQIYSHCDATIRNLIWFRTKLHLCSNMISSQIFWSRALRRRWIRKSLRDSWVVIRNCRLFSVTPPRIVLLHGRGSSVVPPRRTEGYKTRRKDRSQSRSPARVHNRDRSPPRKKSHSGSGWSRPGSSRKTAKNEDCKCRGCGNRTKYRQKSKSVSPDRNRKKKWIFHFFIKVTYFAIN